MRNAGGKGDKKGIGKAFQVFYCYSEDKVLGQAGGERGYFGGLRLQARRRSITRPYPIQWGSCVYEGRG